MVRRRHNDFETLRAVDSQRWLVVSNVSGRVLAWVEFAPQENLKRRFAEAVAAAYDAGWDVEDFDSRYGRFFCRRGEERRYVAIGPTAPADRSGLWRVPEGSGDVRECLGVR